MTTRLEKLRHQMSDQGRAAFVGAAPVQTFQVIGERASGTNFVNRIIRQNMALRPTKALGWKHGFPHMLAIPPTCAVVCAVRNPVDWVLSMHKRPWHAHPDLQALAFSDFIQAEWHSIVDGAGHFPALKPGSDRIGQDLQLDRHPITGQRFANIFKLRTAKLQALMGMVHRDCTVIFVQMEHATQQPHDFLTWLADACALAPPPSDLKLPGRRLGNRFTRSTAARPVTPDALSSADSTFMHAQLDSATEAALGYPLIPG